MKYHKIDQLINETQDIIYNWESLNKSIEFNHLQKELFKEVINALKELREKLFELKEIRYKKICKVE